MTSHIQVLGCCDGWVQTYQIESRRSTTLTERDRNGHFMCKRGEWVSEWEKIFYLCVCVCVNERKMCARLCASVCLHAVLMTSEVERWLTEMERFKGGGDEWREERVRRTTWCSLLSMAWGKGRGERHHHTTGTERERRRKGKRGCDWWDWQKNSITRQKEFLVQCISKRKRLLERE